MEQTTVATAAPKPFVEYVKDYLRGFAVLRDTGREYWALQLINILDMVAYFAMTDIAVVFLSQDVGFSDKSAGYVMTAFSSTVTIFLLFSGVISDTLGIRRSIYVAMIGNLGLRAIITVAGLSPEMPHRGLIVLIALWLLAPFMAMMQTVLQAANRRFTTASSRGAGFNLWYLFMNVGALVGALLLDLVRDVLHQPNAWIIGFGCFTSVAVALVAWLGIRREGQRYAPDETPLADQAGPRLPALERIAEAMQNPVFWRFMLLVTLLLGVRAVFLYLHLMAPKYWLRVIGPDAKIGTLLAVNPFLVILGLILVIPLLKRFSVYGMLLTGGFITSASLFILAWPAWGPAAYTTTLIMLLVLTVGEIIWSPRLYEYTAAIAPRGQEGFYYGLSMVPYFVAKTLVSLLSGHMLTKWVPEYPAGEPILRDRLAAGEIPFWSSPSAMWLLLGVIALLGPLVALALRGWFTAGARWEEHPAH